jgi:hypothetical protein
MLLAGMGERFITRHSHAAEVWWGPMIQKRLERLIGHGIAIGEYDPQADGDAAPAASL